MGIQGFHDADLLLWRRPARRTRAAAVHRVRRAHAWCR
ncbi:hypothetical protein RR42_m4219 [Cupriavidus basilensis]|uniref:Uncharacterized protein n=1 Tax=Cupriavidus basilensis TaxID=68895 RepID=A0A0C4YLU4_9BURK|nr:hypothetical protein RR42_m4219 [Cupriavidus basilensis]